MKKCKDLSRHYLLYKELPEDKLLNPLGFFATYKDCENHLCGYIDLEKETELHFIGADFMQVCGPEVFMPAEVIISISDDGKDFTELKHIEHKVVKDDKVTFTNFGWEGNAKGRYVRYQATSGEFGGFLFTDEVVIK